MKRLLTIIFIAALAAMVAAVAGEARGVPDGLDRLLDVNAIALLRGGRILQASSYDRDGVDDLTLVLAGHPQFESNLRLAVHEAFAQRIVLRIRLRSLHPEEVEAYLTFRLEAAGRTAKLFLPDAVEAIAKAARGVPRLVDRVAEHGLLIALKRKAKEIDAEIVTEAIEEVDP